MSEHGGTDGRLVNAGLDLLAEGGWPAVTSRAVSARAAINVGLIHYHFGGMTGLRHAVTGRAIEEVVGELHREALASPDLPAMLQTIAEGIDSSSSARAAHISAALIDGAVREPALATALREAMSRARGELTHRISSLRSGLPAEDAQTAATLLMAVADGLLLHRLIDPDLQAEPALLLLRPLLQAASEGASR